MKKKVKKLLRTNGVKKLSKEQEVKIGTYFLETYGLKNIRTYWHRLFVSAAGGFTPAYIPEDLFYIMIEPKLNNREICSALTDKNLLGVLFSDIKQPKTILSCINGQYADNNGIQPTEKAYAICDNLNGEFVIKPSRDSYGGRNVLKFTCKSGAYSNGSIRRLIHDYFPNFVLQEAIEQDALMATLNQSSINTFRTITYMDVSGEVKMLSNVVRMGSKGALVDNTSQGGLTCGIQPNGVLNAVGYIKDLSKCYATSSGIAFKDVKLPYYHKVEETSIKLHKRMPWFRLISWDLCIDKNQEVVLIEYNVKGQDILGHQMNNGPVLSPVLECLKE